VKYFGLGRRAASVALAISFCTGVGTPIAWSNDLDRPKDDTKAQEPPSTPQISDEETPPEVTIFGTTGIEVSSTDGRHRMHLWFRGQFRYSYPFDDAPTTA
jgi:hypothetical protein